MGRTSRKRRSSLATRMTIASAALLLGGGGLVAVNVYASAHEETSGPSGESGQDASSAAQQTQVATIDCPDVGNALPDVPDGARGRVDGELATLDSQITEAYQRLASNRAAAAQDPNFVQNSILGPLKDKRVAVLGRIGQDIGRAGGQPPDGLDGMAQCTGRSAGGGGSSSPAPSGSSAPGQDPSQQPGQPGQSGQPEQPSTGNGPEAGDFVAIESVQPNVSNARNQRGASRGTFTTKCGRNENGKFNPDNVIVAPGVSNGAHHMHDYVGNQATDAFSSDDDLAAGQTSCRNQGDKSTYYWPVLRLQNGKDEADAGADGGGKDQNVGEIQTPASVTLKFDGNPTSKVVAMPRFLRIITGDAKAFTNGDANANASWSCTGFENRQLKDKYPICPDGSKVVRTFRFQSCWDGTNTDSANHRTHVAFEDPRTGACPQGFKAIPQLVQRIVYDVPPGPGFAVDSFPEQLHKPVTDHGDFINVFDTRLMQRVASCINRGDRCT
ncbi:DUF1996 domain-containing protein [Streptomyces longispororuber]|uniref:DUF1996 domain-containing protein n=1 Tax=Streptomyces longispororuber TaxID=68230 RepID=UPI00210AAA63|nr:DUF1996 domain-containing protein [Streptomyces longispororuber]MCQ4207121.1 DUF1996 domain-containing protein [Streptomyces longispororuber]